MKLRRSINRGRNEKQMVRMAKKTGEEKKEEVEKGKGGLEKS